MSMQPHGEVRVGTPERSAVMRRLNRAWLEGYISSDEYAERHDSAQNARSVSDITPLIADLPRVPTPGEKARLAWKNRDAMHVWLAGIPAGLAVITVPVAMIVTLPDGIGPAKAAVIAWTMIIGAWIVILSICKAVEAYDRKHGS